jgi:hypothetical protein
MSRYNFSSVSGRVCYGIAVLLLTLGCGDGPAAPSGRELVGAWGSTEAELIALHSGAELRISCTTLIIDDPIDLGDDTDFSARARVYGPGLSLDDLPTIRLTGSVLGSQVTVQVPRSSHLEAATYVLEAGVRPAPQDDPVCPL